MALAATAGTGLLQRGGLSPRGQLHAWDRGLRTTERPPEVAPVPCLVQVSTIAGDVCVHSAKRGSELTLNYPPLSRPSTTVPQGAHCL